MRATWSTERLADGAVTLVVRHVGGMTGDEVAALEAESERAVAFLEPEAASTGVRMEEIGA